MRPIIVIFILLASFFAPHFAKAQHMGVLHMSTQKDAPEEAPEDNAESAGEVPDPPAGSSLPRIRKAAPGTGLSAKSGTEKPDAKDTAPQEEIAIPQADFSSMEFAQTDTVKSIIDPLTLYLDREGISRLSGIEIPDLTPYHQGPIAESALTILKDMIEGKRLRLYRTKDRQLGRKNRLGHSLFHLTQEGSESWVQGTLVRLGLARVRSESGNPEMIRELYALEELARAEKLGLWAFPEYRIYTPEETMEHTNNFLIVEGRVMSAARKQNNIYLNFGHDWKTDFTVAVSTADNKIFFKANMNPLDLNGKTIRVRGWVRPYNGPFMEINHPESIEILDKK